MRQLGIITTGGDCPGLNAVIYSIYQSLKAHNIQLVGISQKPLYTDKPYEARVIHYLEPLVISWAGTFLGSMVDGDIKSFTPERITNIEANFFDAIQEFKLEGLFLLGGDNSIEVAKRILKNIPFIAIPKTIDNDVIYTEQAVGFRSAVETVTGLLDNLRQTGGSHKRVMVAEVMGRDTGFIALESGIAAFADAILIPEKSFDYNELKSFLMKRYHESQHGALIVTAEGAPSLKEFMEKEVALPSRYTKLGHLQRGGTVTAIDRAMAAHLGVHAVDLALKNIWGKAVVWDGHKATQKDILQSSTKRFVTDFKLDLCQKLGIFI